MAVHRIRIAKDKAQLVHNLLEANNSNAPFRTYADILVFGACLGIKYQKRMALEVIAKEPNPISLEVFSSRGYDWIFNLLGITETENPQILSIHNPEAEAEKYLIFEEYANGGLEKLQGDLRGAIDYTERLILILSLERHQEISDHEEFDLSKFI